MTQIATVYSGTEDPAGTFTVTDGDLWVDTNPVDNAGDLPNVVMRVRLLGAWAVPAMLGVSGGAVRSAIAALPDGSVRIDSRVSEDPSATILMGPDIGLYSGTQTVIVGPSSVTVNGTPVP